MRLRTKFILFSNIAVWTTCGLLLYSAYTGQRNRLENDVSENRYRVSREWSSICRHALRSKTSDDLQFFAQLISESVDVDYAYLFDLKGRIIDHTYKRYRGAKLEEWNRFRGLDAQEISQPITKDGRVVARAVVGFSEINRRSQMRDTLRIVLLRHLIIGFGTAVASILLIGFFTDKLTRQLDDLEFATRRIEEEDFQVRLSSRSSDEVGRLATRFNSMAKKLQELDEFRERMITTLSHDMKAPLAAMTMWTDYILKEDPQRDKLIPQHRKVLMTISADAERLRLYAMNILNAARLKGGRLKYDIKPLSLSELVPGLLTPQSMVAKQKGIELVDGVPKDLPKLLADPRHLEQAILNLLANALKFTPPGGRISVMGTADDGRVNISVVDTGKGIAPEDLKRLFQKFTQFDMPDQIRRRVEGSGLGLHIVRHSVEAMGGAVAVESKLGEGSRFTLSFPSAKENGTTGGQDVEKEDTDR